MNSKKPETRRIRTLVSILALSVSTLAVVVGGADAAPVPLTVDSVAIRGLSRSMRGSFVLEAKKSHSIFITSYNPAPEQTDDSPCHGASGRDLCLAAQEGDRVIALSQDLLWFKGGPYRYKDKIKVTSDIPQCNGVYSLEDTMNARFTNMGDLFFLTRKENTSCHAVIEKL